MNSRSLKLAILIIHLFDIVFAKIRTVAFDLELDCFIPIVEHASSDGDGSSMSILEFQRFLTQYGQDRGQYFDSSNPLIAEAFETISDEYCNKLLDICNNETIPITTDNFDELSSSQKVYVFHVCEEGFVSIQSILASSAPSSVPSLMPSLSDGYPFHASTAFYTYSSIKQPELTQFMNGVIESWSNDSALAMSSSEFYYQYKYLHFSASITSCNDKRALKKVEGPKIYCYNVDVTVHMRTNANVSQGEEQLGSKLRAAVDFGSFNDCNSEESSCSVFSFYPEDRNNRVAIASVGSIAAVAVTVGLVYWVRRRSEGNQASAETAFPIKIPTLPEFDEDILIEGGNHIVGTWSECSDDSYE